MNKLIEALTFLVSTFGAINIVVLFLGSSIVISKFVFYVFEEDKKDRKKLIKETIEEAKNE